MPRNELKQYSGDSASATSALSQSARAPCRLDFGQARQGAHCISTSSHAPWVIQQGSQLCVELCWQAVQGCQLLLLAAICSAALQQLVDALA